MEDAQGSNVGPSYVYSVEREKKDLIQQFQVCEGRDFQDISWGALGHQRISYRRSRLTAYSRHPPLTSESRRIIRQLPKPRKRTFYNHYGTYKRARPGISHFQLRHLLTAISRASVTYLSKNGVWRLHAPTLTIQNLLPFSGDFFCEGHQICSLLCWNDIIFAGSFQGHVLIKKILANDKDRIPKVMISEAKDSICNALTRSETDGGGKMNVKYC